MSVFILLLLILRRWPIVTLTITRLPLTTFRFLPHLHNGQIHTLPAAFSVH